MKTLQQLHDDVMRANTAAILSIVEQKQSLPASHPVSIYFLMNFTINPIEPFLKYYLYESCLHPDVVFGNYDSVSQDILDDTSPLHSKTFDIIVCSLMYFPTDAAFLDRLNDTSAFIAELETLFNLIQQKTSGLILLNTFLPPLFSESGITSPKNKKNHIDAILEINHFIRNYVREHAGRCYLMDWQRYMQILGEDSIDYRYWYMYKAPFKKAFLSYYANDMAKIARALKGYAKKCLIVDCDNTLWGGIVGEEGLSGIQLDNHEYPGKIFYDFQKTLVDLAQRGIILAVCSKNNEQDVWEVFEKHPHCLLRREHLAAYRINWANKADNIIELVKELNIGLDACVFVDDSPTECELVQLALPDVTVIKVPQPLYNYPSLLLKSGLFDTLVINEEDAERNLNYQQEAKRNEVLKNSQDISEYLASLELVATIRPIHEKEIPRVSQLTQKTNQFNLSTRRYSQQQIEHFSFADDSVIFTLNVKDKFGSYGLTGVLIAKREGSKGFIDSFLISCRILSRNLEYVFLEHCLNQLSQHWGLSQWETEYIQTEKNSQVQDFLTKAGFNQQENTIYSLNMNEWKSYNINHISTILEGFGYA